MNKDKIKEKITYYRTLLTLIWTGVFLLGSGVTWAFMNLKNIILFVPVTGIVIEVSFLLALIFLDKRIRKLLKEL